MTLAHTYYTAVDNFAFMAIPLFVFAGSLMEQGGISQKLIDVADIVLGRLVGGLGLVTIATCMFFAAITGCGNTATAAVGALMIPSMLRRNYDPGFSGALAAIGGTLGILIPPSIVLIVYGIIADLSIARLFLAGVVPGILLGFVLMGVAFIIGVKRGYKGSETRFAVNNFASSLYRAKWALLAPVIILGGIYGGFITPTESAVIAVLYAYLVGTFIHKELSFQKFCECLRSSVAVTGVVGIIWGTALGFGQLIAILDIPQSLSAAILSISKNPIMILILISAWTAFVGMWMNTMAQVLILTPIYLVIIESAGIDPIAFGIIFVLNCEVGFVTPPLGTSLFIAMPIANVGLGRISYASLPFILGVFIVIGMLILFPGLALWLPNLVMGPGG